MWRVSKSPLPPPLFKYSWTTRGPFQSWAHVLGFVVISNWSKQCASPSFLLTCQLHTPVSRESGAHTLWMIVLFVCCHKACFHLNGLWIGLASCHAKWVHFITNLFICSWCYYFWFPPFFHIPPLPNHNYLTLQATIYILPKTNKQWVSSIICERAEIFFNRNINIMHFLCRL